MKRTMCSRVPKFAAYSRRTIPEGRGKIETGRPDPGYGHPRPAVLLVKTRACSEISDFSPHFRNNDSASRVLATKAASATTSSSRDYIKGPLPETEQRPFFVSASRRVRGDCITEDIIFNQIKSAVRTLG